jgi:hypothetical protein
MMRIGLNQMKTPQVLTIDSFNTLYVADTNNHRILKFLNGTSTSKIIAGQALGIPGSTGFDLCGPKSAVVDRNDNGYIADMLQVLLEVD